MELYHRSMSTAVRRILFIAFVLAIPSSAAAIDGPTLESRSEVFTDVSMGGAHRTLFDGSDTGFYFLDGCNCTFPAGPQLSVRLVSNFTESWGMGLRVGGAQGKTRSDEASADFQYQQIEFFFLSQWYPTARLTIATGIGASRGELTRTPHPDASASQDTQDYGTLSALGSVRYELYSIKDRGNLGLRLTGRFGPGAAFGEEAVSASVSYAF